MSDTTTAAKKPRTRTKAEYLIEKKDGERWVDINAGAFADTNEALARLRDEALEGTFRIIAVKRIVTAKISVKTSITLE